MLRQFCNFKARSLNLKEYKIQLLGGSGAQNATDGVVDVLKDVNVDFV